MTVTHVERLEEHEEAVEIPIESEECVFRIEDDDRNQETPNEDVGFDKFDLGKEDILKPSIEDPSDLELKEVLQHLEYTFLGKDSKLPVIIASNLSKMQKEKLLNVLKKHKRAIAWKFSAIKGINLSFCTYKILMEDNHKPSALPQ